ncbi:Vegetative incompatibility protein HET-E-1-like protein 15, partial [Colletotrichum sojae]
YIQLGRRFEQDREACRLRLGVSQVRLSRWGQAVQINDNPCFVQLLRLDDKEAQLAKSILEQIATLFESARRKSRQYEQAAGKDGLLDFDDKATSHTNRSLHEKLTQRFRTGGKHASLAKRTSWALYDGRNLERLLDLDQCQQFVSAAVERFIDHKVDILRRSKVYPEDIANLVRKHWTSNANNTFLWVALVCKRLEQVQRWDVRRELGAFPAGLDTLYRRMFDHVATPEHGLYRKILALMTVVYRPIKLEELRSLLDDWYDIETSDLPEIIQHCGFFLTLQEGTVSFVHYSAKEFLLASANDQLFPLGLDKQHQSIVSRRLEAMSSYLKRNIYDVRSLDAAVGKLEVPNPDSVAAVLYSTIYWIDHLQESHHSIEGDAKVCLFIYTHFLHWLEALALQQKFAVAFEGIRKMLLMCEKSQESRHERETFAKDALRFASKFGSTIEDFPLQAYASSLLFAPTSSDVRRRLWNQRDCRGAEFDGIDSTWGPDLLVLDLDPELVTAVAFSDDGQILVSASSSNHWSIQLWDARTGRKPRPPISVDANVLDRIIHSPWAITLSPNSSMVALASETGATTVYSVETGKSLRCFPTNNGRNPFFLEPRIQVVFSSDGRTVASLSSNGTASFWYWETGTFLGTFQSIIAISPQGDKLVQQDVDKIVLRRSDREDEQPSSPVVPGLTLIDETEMRWRSTPSVLFTHGSDVIMIADSDKITVCDTKSGTRQIRLIPDSAGLDSYRRLAVSPDAMVIALMPSIHSSRSMAPHTIQLWSSTSHTLQRTLRGNYTSVFVPTRTATSLAFSPDGTMLASSWGGGIVQLWDLTTDLVDPVAEEADMSLETLTLSPDGSTLARTSGHTTQVFNFTTNEHWETTEAYRDTITADEDDFVRQTVFSPNGDLLACVQASMIQLWRVTTGRLQRTSPEDKRVSFQNLSLHNEMMAIMTHDKLCTPDTRTSDIRPGLQVQLWHITSESLVQMSEFGERDEPTSAFSPTGNMLALASATGFQLLSTVDGAVLHTSRGTGGRSNVLSFSSDERTMAAACPMSKLCGDALGHRKGHAPADWP